MPISLLHAEIQSGFSVTGLVHAVITAVSFYVQLPGCVQKTLFPCSHGHMETCYWSMYVQYTQLHFYLKYVVEMELPYNGAGNAPARQHRLTK